MLLSRFIGKLPEKSQTNIQQNGLKGISRGTSLSETVERTSQWACESYLDAAAHSVSRLGFREARDNKVLFVILFKNGVISESTSQAMVKMSKFRNIVVHDYARIDPEIVIGILKKDLRDFTALASEIIRFLDTDTRINPQNRGPQEQL